MNQGLNNYLKSVSRNKPVSFLLKHPFFVFTLFSIYLGFLGWQYNRGFHNALGIVISFDHIENMLFLFSRVLTFQLFPKLKNVEVIIFISLLSFLIKAFLNFHKAKIFPKDKVSGSRFQSFERFIQSELFNTNLKDFLIIFIITINITFVYNFLSHLGNLISAMFFIIIGFLTIASFFEDSFSRKVNFNLLVLFIVFSTIISNSLYEVGIKDGYILVKEKYVNQKNVCILNPDHTKYLKCGKLLKATKSYFFIIFESPPHPVILRRDKYEYTVFNHREIY